MRKSVTDSKVSRLHKKPESRYQSKVNFKKYLSGIEEKIDDFLSVFVN